MTNFDSRAKTWDSDPKKVERAAQVAQAIRAALPLQPGMTALEVGCGTGLLSFAMQSDFAHITLADTSEGMLDVLAAKIAESGVTNMVPLRLDLSTNPAPVSRFDVTYSLMVLHHIPDTDHILRQFHALLKPGGWLAIADLDAEDGTFHTDGSTDVHLGFERAALQKQVETAGFVGVKFSTPYIIRKKIGEAEKSFPVFLLIAQKPVLANPDGKPSDSR
jgi:2-polyprenyl-3-methyl-5-hydroxy-6-metoxy-1,4-benzoquinol methylase